MRVCKQCKKEDSVYWEPEPCNCGSEQPDPLKHDPRCRSIGHDVVEYPIRITRDDLWFDQNGDPHISAYHAGRGWVLKIQGPMYFRTKLLCRDCIGKYAEAQARHREYRQACKKARGDDSMTYAQMLASQ